MALKLLILLMTSEIPEENFIITYVNIFTGMDAQVSYAFHSERKLHPEKFRNQLSNQVFFNLPYVLQSFTQHIRSFYAMSVCSSLPQKVTQFH